MCFALPSNAIPPLAAARDYALVSFMPGRPVLEAARELDLRPSQLADRMLVAPGDEVDRGQALAQVISTTGVLAARSPLRGRVERVDLEFGLVLVAPLAEKIELAAALPGTVTVYCARGSGSNWMNMFWVLSSSTLK